MVKSVYIREKEEGIGYKNGQIRLLEHDMLTSSDLSSAIPAKCRFSFMDDPSLEINQL